MPNGRRCPQKNFHRRNQKDLSDVMSLLASLYGFLSSWPIPLSTIDQWSSLLSRICCPPHKGTPDAKAWFASHISRTHLAHSIIIFIAASVQPIFQLLPEQKEYRWAGDTNQQTVNPLAYTIPLQAATLAINKLRFFFAPLQIVKYL